jgi:mannose-1-phosphate guanylyltransferase
MRHAVIMAGGAGTRLWPLSRVARPKQVLRLFGGESLLRHAYERIAGLLEPDAIYVITGSRYLPAVAEELPELPERNLLGEPQGRDTANAVGLAAAVLRQRDPDAVMGIFTADHIIMPIDRFRDALDLAYGVAEREANALVTLGVRPSSPHTGYGYVRRGAALAERVYGVEEFTEKPDLARATEYVAAGNYYWNSGMFTWRAATILDQLHKYLPKSYEGLSQIAVAWDTPQRQERLERVYPTLIKISIDFAVMERAEHVLVVEMDCQWVDVGSWTAFESLVSADADGNVNAASATLNLGSRGNILVSEDDHLIATIGVDDLVIVHSADATLICTRRDAQSIKELVARVRQQFGEKYV